MSLSRPRKHEIEVWHILPKVQVLFKMILSALYMHLSCDPRIWRMTAGKKFRSKSLHSPGNGTELKLSVSVVRRLSRWPCSAMFVLRCCTASISSFSMACFMLSMCLLRIAFCSSSSVVCFLSCLSSPSRAKTQKLGKLRYNNHLRKVTLLWFPMKIK